MSLYRRGFFESLHCLIRILLEILRVCSDWAKCVLILNDSHESQIIQLRINGAGDTKTTLSSNAENISITVRGSKERHEAEKESSIKSKPNDIFRIQAGNAYIKKKM